MMPASIAWLFLGTLSRSSWTFPPLPAPKTSVFGIEHDPVAEYNQKRTRLNTVLEEHGFRYFRGGRVIPNGGVEPEPTPVTKIADKVAAPSDIEELLQRLIRGLPRAMHPLAYRRKDARSLLFESEYDIQDLLHSQLRPWVADIRPEGVHAQLCGIGNCRVDDWRGGGRRRGVAVSGSFRRAGASLPAIAPFPVAAHRTGRAVFPHPALGRDHAFAHGKLVVRGPRCVSP